MTRSRHPLIILTIFVGLLSGTTFARQGRQSGPPPQTAAPARDAPTVVYTGTASISGTVVSDDDAATPLRHVTLTLARTGVADSRLTATDDRGRFLFKDVPAGSFTLTAQKGGFVNAGYGATKIGLPGSPFSLTDGQQFAAHPIKMTRGAVITGTLTNAKGKPEPRTVVEATQFQTVTGERSRRRVPNGSGSATTDAQGTFRIFGLAPGDYLVGAKTNDLFSFTNESRELTAAELRWAQDQVQHPGAPVDPVVIAAATKVGPALTSAPTFYPGTGDPAAAVIVTLTRGEERAGVDFPLLYLPTARLAGVVMNPDGHPAAGATALRVAKQANQFVSSFDPGTTSSKTGADGKFSFPGVAPGEYTIAVRGPAGASALWGMTDVTMNGDDITNVTVSLQPGATVSGTIAFDGSVLQPPSDLTRVQTRLVTPPNTPTVLINSTPRTAKADGTFTIDDVTPGAYRMSATAPTTPGAANNWVMTSATLNGKNVLDFPFDVQPGQDVSGLAVTFSDRQTEFTGTLIDAAGKPTPQFYVLVYSTDKNYWTQGSRWVKPSRAGLDGKFKITGLPPGEYFVCALTELDNSQMTDPGYLEQFVSASTKITLADGEKRALDLRVGGF
jgi:hypothetical protein